MAAFEYEFKLLNLLFTRLQDLFIFRQKIGFHIITFFEKDFVLETNKYQKLQNDLI